MPYVQQDMRKDLDPTIQLLIEKLAALPLDKQDGALNYTITRLLHGVYQPESYFTYNRSMGVLSSAQAEWYRRRVAPYEDRKISENGDV
ncbi:hypothetical protein IPL68_07040 [Candidatus Saccharibacteria bacterium]|nr:MAG: hypothetical protein IPL68_07040 [Candidatus Saccharibacteria bacterium]